MAVAKQTKDPIVFQWQGLNKRGKTVTGEITANSQNEAKALLRKQGLTPSKIKRKAKPLLSFSKPIKPADIALLTRQIATMLQAGVALIQALEMVAQGSSAHPKLKAMLEEITRDVSGGQPLAPTLRKHPKYFDDLYCDLVNSGEQSGSLDIVFNRVAIYKEKAEALKSKIKKAMFYPTAVMVVAGVVTAVLLIFVVPQFEQIFSGFGAELPAFTQLVIRISEFMQTYWWLVLAFLVAGGMLFSKLRATNKKFSDGVDHALLKAPVFGDILKKAAVARFSRTLSTTFAAGVPLVDALASAAGASGNAFYRDAIIEIRNEVSSGNQMNFAMRNTGAFPDMVNQMVAIGEESGALDDMLAKVASIYEQEVDDAVDGLSSLMEPIIMAVLGVVVGGLIIAMYLPIFQLGSVIK